jgi:UDP-glucose 4-epimerase
MIQHVLVTGGAGYIGGATVRLLLQNSYKVTVLDDLSRGHRNTVHRDSRLVVGNTGDTVLLTELFSENSFDAVMHFAAFAEVGESMLRPELYFRNNTSATLTLLEACLRHRVDRFVFSSSTAVFGVPQTVPIAESAPRDPVNPYGLSKLQTEVMLEWFRQTHGLRYAVLRYFNAAGAWDGHGECHEPESHLIPNVLRAALGSRPVPIFGTDYPTRDGTCVRDYIHIYDLSVAHLLVLRELLDGGSQGAASPSSGPLIYNLGNGLGFSIREVISTASRVTGRNILAIESPRRPGDPPTLIANAEKIRRELGWSPRYPHLEDILASAWAWHSDRSAACPDGSRTDCGFSRTSALDK